MRPPLPTRNAAARRQRSKAGLRCDRLGCDARDDLPAVIAAQSVVKIRIPTDISTNQRWRTAMFHRNVHPAIVAAACLVALTASLARAQGITQPKQGQGGSVVKGAAGTDGKIGRAHV